MINEHYPYYGYADIEGRNPALSPLTRKVGRLCLRLANRVQPAVVVSFGTADAVFGSYFRAGCRALKYVEVPAGTDAAAFSRIVEGFPSVDILRLTPCEGFEDAFRAACTKAREGSVFIIDDIRRDASARRLWCEVVRTQPGVVTFDLYYCGLVCFQSKLFKRNYIVNF